MKNCILFGTCLFMFVFFSSCEKEPTVESIINNERSEKDYIFYNPKWELSIKNHEDNFGNVGDLYVNKNNKKEFLFEVQSNQSSSNFNAAGTYTKIYSDLGQVIGVRCSGPAHDCRMWLVEKDGVILEAVILRYPNI